MRCFVASDADWGPLNYINRASICPFFIYLSIYVSFTYLPTFIFPYFNSFHRDPSISANWLSVSNGRQVTREFVVSRLKTCKYLYFFTSFIGDRCLTFSSQPRFFSRHQKRRSSASILAWANIHFLIWDELWRPMTPACLAIQPLDVRVISDYEIRDNI